MNWKFIFAQLKNYSITANFRIILVVSRTIIPKRSYGSDHVLVSLPILIPAFLLIKVFITNEDFKSVLILPLILVMMFPAHLFIKKNERIVLNKYPEIKDFLFPNRKEFILIWLLFNMLFCSLCIGWYLSLVYFVFGP
jgi:hypothetical protein